MQDTTELWNQIISLNKMKLLVKKKTTPQKLWFKTKKYHQYGLKISWIKIWKLKLQTGLCWQKNVQCNQTFTRSQNTTTITFCYLYYNHYNVSKTIRLYLEKLVSRSVLAHADYNTNNSDLTKNWSAECNIRNNSLKHGNCTFLYMLRTSVRTNAKILAAVPMWLFVGINSNEDAQVA